MKRREKKERKRLAATEDFRAEVEAGVEDLGDEVEAILLLLDE